MASDIPVASLIKAPKSKCSLFLIEIRLRNYTRRVDKEILFYKIQQKIPDLEFIISIDICNGRKTKYRSGFEFKLLINTENTTKKTWSSTETYIFVDNILRSIVGEEQKLSTEDRNSKSKKFDIDKFPEIFILTIKLY